MELVEGEEICKLCKGEGRIKYKDIYCFCADCKGTGKIDWIEKISGKHIDESAVNAKISTKIINYCRKIRDGKADKNIRDFLTDMLIAKEIYAADVTPQTILVNDVEMIKASISFKSFPTYEISTIYDIDLGPVELGIKEDE